MMRFKTWLVIHYSKHLLLFGKSVNSFSRCTWKAICSLMNLKLRAESERSQTLHLKRSQTLLQAFILVFMIVMLIFPFSRDSWQMKESITVKRQMTGPQ